MKILNEMTLTIKAISENESFARSCVSAFCVGANLSLDELTEIKTAVSEAVTNSVVHAYPNSIGDIKINAKRTEDRIYISITDYGIGIEDIERAREPFSPQKVMKNALVWGLQLWKVLWIKLMLKRIRMVG